MFYQSVGDGVVRQLCGFAWYQVAASVGTRVQIRTDVPVRGNCGGCTKVGNPARDESAGNSLCGDVGDGYGFWSSRESINAGEEIGTSFRRWKWSNEVDVDVVKASIRAC